MHVSQSLIHDGRKITSRTLLDPVMHDSFGSGRRHQSKDADKTNAECNPEAMQHGGRESKEAGQSPDALQDAEAGTSPEATMRQMNQWCESVLPALSNLRGLYFQTMP